MVRKPKKGLEASPLNTNEAPVSGILLAGGKSARMGTDKAFLDIGGERLIDRILKVYKSLFDDIVIVTNEPLAFLEFSEAAVVTDIYKGKGPLGGIYTGLFYAKNPCAFVSACDMPFLSAAFIAFLVAQTGRQDIIVPVTENGYQPLCAVYSQKCLPSILRLLLLDQLKITGFYRDMQVLAVGKNQIAPFNPDGRLFRNLNTPDDLNEIFVSPDV